MSNSNGIQRGEYTSQLTSISASEHIWFALKNHLIEFLTVGSGFFLTIFGICEIFFSFGYQFNITLAAVSVIVASIYVAYAYYHSEPESFESESFKVKKIAHLKRPKWEFELAYELLKDRLSDIDKDLEELLKGRKYVPLIKEPDETEYFEWLRLRPTNLIEMSSVASNLLVHDLPPMLNSDEENKNSAQDILESVEKIERLYKNTLEFELEGRQVKPPQKFKKLHELQFGFSNPIRNGINQMFDFLEEVINADLKDNEETLINFSIKLESPDNIEEFLNEMDRLNNQL